LRSYLACEYTNYDEITDAEAKTGHLEATVRSTPWESWKYKAGVEVVSSTTWRDIYRLFFMPNSSPYVSQWCRGALRELRSYVD
jgi:hypothetical protein